jgi:outer membrane protein assembly factor BamB
VAKGVVYVGSDNGTLYALNAATGAFKWSCSIGSDYSPSSPAVANGVVYVTSYYHGDSFFYALDAATGAVKWSYSTGDSSRFSPIIVNGRVYVSSGDGLYCFSPNPGGEVLSQRIPRPDPTLLVPNCRLDPQGKKYREYLAYGQL